MAVLALAAAGAMAGGAIGGSAFVASLGWTIGSAIGLMFFGPKAELSQGPRLNDTRVQASTYGQMIPVLYGTMRLAGQIIWSTDIQEHKTDIDVGKGLFGGTSQVTYWYDVSFAVGVCEGPMAGVIRIWADSKLIYDARPQAKKKQKYKKPIRIYLGDEEQLADAEIEADIGAGDVPPFRGLCYVVFEDLPLADFGNRIPNITVEVTSSVVNAHGVQLASGFQPEIELSDPLKIRMSREALIMDPRPDYPYLYAHSVRLKTGVGDSTTPSFLYKLNEADCTIVDQKRVLNHWGQHGEIDIDNDGYIYAHAVGGQTFTFQPIGKFDSTTLQEVLRARDPLTLAEIRTVSGGFRVDRRSSQRLVWHWTQSDLDHGNLSAFSQAGLLRLWRLPRIAFGMSGGFASGARKMWDVEGDSDGNAWVLAGVATTMRLYRVTPGALFDLWDEIGSFAPYASALMYVETDHTLIIGCAGSSPALVKYDIESKTVLATSTALTFSHNTNSFHHGDRTTSLWIATLSSVPSPDGGNELVPTFTEFSTADLSVLRTEVMAEMTPYQPNALLGFTRFAPANAIYDAARDIIHAENMSENQVGCFSLSALGDCVSLKSVVEDISTRAGLTVETDIDANALANDQVCGYVINRPAPLRQWLEPLVTAYFFGGVESNGIVVYRKKGGTSLLTIAESDLATHGEGSDRPLGPLLETRIQEIELPERIDIKFINRATQYEQADEHAKRLLRTIGTREQIGIELPLVFSAGEAKQIAEKLLYLAWIERHSIEFTLPYRYLRLDPLDPITLSLESGVEFLTRLVQVDLGGDGLLQCRGLAEDLAVYTPAWLGQTTEQWAGPTIPVTSPTVLQLLDIPLLRDSDDDAGFYAAIAPVLGAESDWRGAVLFRAPDAGDWHTAAILTAAAPMGYALSALGATDRWTVWDEANSVTVQLYDGTLSNASARQVLDYTNVALLGDELIQWRTATLNVDGSYTLSGLLRARRGTEWAVGAHQVGERFVVLSTGQARRLLVPPDGAVGLQQDYRAVTLGEEFDEAGMQSFANTAAGLKPYSPGHISGARDESDNLTVTWLRRTRVGGEWEDGHDVPLGEEEERYELAILTGTDTVVRILETTTPTATYTAAQQSEDFGSPQAVISLDLYQISARVGRGFGRRAEV